jgi:hypothetical protein
MPSYLRPAQAAKHWPHDGRPSHPSRIVRTIVRPKPSCARPEESIRLRAIRDSQGWLTTADWIEEYVAALTADRLGPQAPNPMVEARSDQAMIRLAAAGWKRACEGPGRDPGPSRGIPNERQVQDQESYP